VAIADALTGLPPKSQFRKALNSRFLPNRVEVLSKKDAYCNLPEGTPAKAAIEMSADATCFFEGRAEIRTLRFVCSLCSNQAADGYFTERQAEGGKERPGRSHCTHALAFASPVDLDGVTLAESGEARYPLLPILLKDRAAPAQ